MVLVADREAEGGDFLLLVPFAVVGRVALAADFFQHLVDQHAVAGEVGLLVVAGDQQAEDLLPFLGAAEGEVGPAGRGEQDRHALADHRPMEGEGAEAVRRFADQHAVAVEGAEVRGPDQLLQQFAEHRVGDFGDPFVVGEAVAQLADLLVQAVAVVRGAAPDVAFGLQGFQEAADRRPVQAGRRAQFGDLRPAVGRAVDRLQYGQPAAQALDVPVGGIARWTHGFPHLCGKPIVKTMLCIL